MKDNGSVKDGTFKGYSSSGYQFIIEMIKELDPDYEALANIEQCETILNNRKENPFRKFNDQSRSSSGSNIDSVSVANDEIKTEHRLDIFPVDDVLSEIEPHMALCLQFGSTS